MTIMGRNRDFLKLQYSWIDDINRSSVNYLPKRMSHKNK